jgi:hypothetical protein
LMVSHVRVRLVNGLCHGLTDGNGFWVGKGMIDGESCPREVENLKELEVL